MSKVTFRADDDLVDRLESLEVSKSEAMREALRLYLDTVGRDADPSPSDTPDGSIDEALCSLIDARIDRRLAAERRHPAVERRHPTGSRPHTHAREQYYTEPSSPVTINLTIDGRDGIAIDEGVEGTVDETVENRPPTAESSADRPSDEDPSVAAADRKTADARPSHQCNQCGEPIDREHVYCPNCGEKASRRLFCDCGDEVRSDWAFCPSCGRRTPAADVLGTDPSHNPG